MAARFDTGFPASGRLQLQVCTDCGQANYPRRELCGNCLADALAWQVVPPEGLVQSLTELQHSLEAQYTDHLPWTVASIKLDCGPVAFAHLQPGLTVGSRVSLRILSDQADNRMLVALGDNRAAAEQWVTTIAFREDE